MDTSIVLKQRVFFESGKTRDLAFRREQLHRLKGVILKHEENILAALHKDMKKPRFEAYLSEIAICIDEIECAIKNLSRWARPKSVSTPILHFFSTSKIYSEPLGVVLIIAPWNYPFQLCIAPLIAAMAAGNCSVLKPSELSPRISAVITEMIGEAFASEYIASIEGGVEQTQALLAERFDHIFFTGGIAVGKIVMQAAAKHLTPVTLELGGKSPCIVDSSFPLEHAARRIVWGKFFNTGQTCVGPDYLLVEKKIKSELLEKMKQALKEFYGENPNQSADYGRIINDRHFARLTGLMKSGRIVAGGQIDAKERYIAPTLIDDVTMDDPIMGEEIFGPLLPILGWENFDQVISTIRQRPQPLALYLFSKNKHHQDRILKDIPFGGGCFNDTLIHLSSTNLPFGGVGTSGMGAYHGKTGFDLFSHRKSVLKKTPWFDVKIRYAPYSEGKLKLVKRLFG